MADALVSQSNLDSLAITITLSKNGKSFLRKLAAELGEEDEARALVLSKDRKLPYFATVFGISQRAKSKQTLYGIHVHFDEKPSGTPPKSVSALQKRGRTVEWLIETLQENLSKTEIAACESKISIGQIPVTRSNVPLALPLRVDGRELLLAGAEYRVAEKGAIFGLSTIRWLEREDRTLDVWLSYVVKWEEIGQKPWLSEKDRALKYAMSVL